MENHGESNKREVFTDGEALLLEVAERMNMLTVAYPRDVVSSFLHLSNVPDMANVVDLFGVPLNTLGDIDKLTKDIELGKYEVWSDLPINKCTEVMDTFMLCGMLLWLKTLMNLGDQTIALEVELTDKIHALMAMIKDKKGIHTDQQMLIFGGAEIRFESEMKGRCLDAEMGLNERDFGAEIAA
uniref:Ubiquitin-like domain-containing protein n=1 Tax=Tanacetum cinerariifolium TaxID=118510 RepID=A0A6L2K7K7_TANCI|nr:hypothetical protein [Tanacetum cinerariifolium]